MVFTETGPLDPLVQGDLFHIRATFDVSSSERFGFSFGDTSIVYDVTKRELQSKAKAASLVPKDGVIALEVRWIVYR